MRRAFGASLDRTSPALVAIAILAAAVTLRPSIVAIGALTPRIAGELGTSYAAIGFITTLTIVLVGLAAPLGPSILHRWGFRRSMAATMAVLLVAGLARAISPAYPLLLFWSGTIGILIGIGQSIGPTLGRGPSISPRLASGSFTVGLVGSAIVAAAVAVLVATWTGGWRSALIAVSVPIVGSIVIWLIAVPGHAHAGHPDPTMARLPISDREARWLALAFGLQAVLYHSLVAWLPEIAAEAGDSEVLGGFLLAILNAAALAASVAVLLLGGLGSTSFQIIIVSGVACLSVIALASGAPRELAVATLGLSLGAVLPLMVSLGLARSADPATASSLIALIFLVGFVLAGLAPLLIGILRDATGGFASSLWLLALDALLLVVVAIRVHGPDRRRRSAHLNPPPKVSDGAPELDRFYEDR